MERSDNTVRSGDDGIAIASSRFPTSAALVAAIKRGEPPAIRELFILYAPLLRDQARLMGIDRGEEEAFVTTLLDDVVLHLIDSAISPRDLARYLVAALRNRARNLHRDRKRIQASLDRAYSPIGDTRQLVVAESHSDYAIRSAASHADEMPLRGAIAKLAEKSAAMLSGDELRMMIAVGRHMPLREFAEQNGMSYSNARVRLHRLRARFAKLAVQYVALLEPVERHEIERFFSRAGVPLGHASTTNQRTTPSPYRTKPERTNEHN